MNPNNNQLPQDNQVIISTPQMSQEDLTRTQVLNLSDVEKVASYEKKTSKRPAIFLAIAGIFAIIVGIAYNPIMTAIDGEEELVQNESNSGDVNNGDVVENNSQVETLSCTISQAGNSDGTDTTTTIVLSFNDLKLQSYTKSLTVTPTVGNTAGPTTIQTLLQSYKSLEANQVNGYSISTQQVDTGIQSNISIDLSTLDKNLLTDVYRNNTFTNVEYDLNTPKDTVTTALTTAGYVCQ